MTERQNNGNNNAGRRTAAETAYAYLASRMRTVSEVERHLRDKGYSGDEISETVSELRELNYLDDYQYAMRYFEYNREKRRGSLRAERELAEKGISAEIIRNAREDYLYAEDVDEYEDALAVALRETRLAGKEPDERLLGKIARKLENSGYSRDIIFRILDRLR